MGGPDHLFVQVIRASAGLLVWTAHFIFSYLVVAGGCLSAEYGRSGPAPGWVLLLGSALALGAVGAMLWRSVRRLGQRHAALFEWARAGGAVLALIGIVWSSVPMLMLGQCI